MSAKRWFIMLLCIVVLIAVSVVLLNVLVDPFSVFGDRLYDWNSYGMTNNPKVAKYAYIDDLRGQYDAFVIGPSGSSGFSTESLDKYTGLRWYNMFHYGANIDYTKKLAGYLIENHNPKQLLLCLPPVCAVAEPHSVAEISSAQPLQPFWRLPFLYANPAFSFTKINANGRRGYVQNGEDVFIAQTGEYNKTRRDAEAIGSMEEYLVAYPEFVDHTYWYPGLQYIDECADAVAEIAAMCKSRGIGLTIVAPPMTAGDISAFKAEQVKEFYSKITEISGYWSFMASSVSADPRYFYDTTHFRNSVGEMMVAKMFGDDNAYIPDGFGVPVTADNVDSVIDDAFTAEIAFESEPYTTELPVLTYHHITEESTKGSEISIDRFREHMRILREAGYSAVSLEQVRDYVLLGIELPELPVLITFDDGYMSNYTEAFPILSDYGFHAAIFIIGVSFGKETYKDTGEEITPHFGYAEALEMAKSGLVTIQSHSFDLHHAVEYDVPFRQGVLIMDGESEQDYIDLFRNDYALMQELLKDFGDVYAFSYPYGRISVMSSILLRELGVQMTFSVNEGINTLVKGLPQSLLELKRFSITDDIAGDKLLRMISLGVQ